MLTSLEEMPEWYEFRKRYQHNILAFAVEVLGMDGTDRWGTKESVTWQQEMLFDSIRFRGSRTSCSSGHGCFGINTEVMLHDGTVKFVQDVNLDDILMGDDGKSQRHVFELKRGRENLYQFTYQDGSAHVFNESHILCLKSWLTGQKITTTVRDWLLWSQEEKRRYVCYRFISDGCYTNIAITAVTALGEGDYYGFVLNENQQFLGADGTVLHNTGKTRSMAIVALWHLLCFPHSVTMFTAPQIQQLRNQTWKEISICFMRLKSGPYKWLADYIKILAEKVYIIGNAATWHVLAKTAPKNSPTNIAGQHGTYLLIWGDEASGIEDKVLDTLSGALTHANNRMVLTSQPTRGAGFFFDTHHRLSYNAVSKSGKRGRWVSIVMNSELSPIVTPEFLAELLQKYGSRDHPLYQIRVRGLFPDLNNEFIAGRRACEATYAGTCIHGTARYGYVIAVDVGGGIGRDDSVVAVGKVSGDAHHGSDARKVEVVDIPLCDNTSQLTQILNVIDHQMSLYPNATLVVDANGAGRGLAQKLGERGIPFQEVNWGGQCFDEQAKTDYANKRSQAIVCLGRAVTEGRFKIFTPVAQPKVLEQISRLPYTFDNRARWFVYTKEQMSAKGIKSPDIADVFAFMFMDDVMPIPVESVGSVSSGAVSDAMARLKAEAAARGLQQRKVTE